MRMEPINQDYYVYSANEVYTQKNSLIYNMFEMMNSMPLILEGPWCHRV